MAAVVLHFCTSPYSRPFHSARSAPMRLSSPASFTLDDIISTSLDNHARRLQRITAPPETKLLQLSDARVGEWERVVDALAPFMKEKRLRRLQKALRGRRANLHLVVENIADPFNSQSLMRTAEALGVQRIHVIESISEFQLPAEEARVSSRGSVGKTKGGAGASRWLTLTKYRSSREALDSLRALGLLVHVSDCPTGDDDGTPSPVEIEGNAWVTAKRGNPRAAVPIEALDFSGCDEGSYKGVALVFGNERRGCSRVFTEGGDASFFLPMSGFTQSFNIGVALAMSLSAVIASGAFPSGSLAEDDRIELMGRWLLRDVKAARTLLLQAGLEFEDF